MRNLLLVLVLVVGLTACEDDVLLPKAKPSLQKTKPAVIAMPRVDTTKASSVCRASVRAGGRLRQKLDAAPDDSLARKSAQGYASMIAAACK